MKILLFVIAAIIVLCGVLITFGTIAIEIGFKVWEFIYENWSR